MKQSPVHICFVTGSRAEYGLLLPLMKKIKGLKKFHLQVIATGMHLSPEFGLTYRDIERDGFVINEKVEMLLSSDTASGVAKSMGIECIGLAGAFERLKPDLIVLLGDRFETFIAASVANVFRIPIAHLHGGELTEGAYDEAFRHAITKMSHLHFTSTNAYRKRVIQLGESPGRVFSVGAIGLDNIVTLPLMTREALEKDLDIVFDKNNLLVTFHPVTTQAGSAVVQCEELLRSLSRRRDTLLLMTKANADNEGRKINALLADFAAEDPSRRKVFASLGQLRYLSLMKFVDGVVGNSSSGIIEAPSFRIGTINIGDRQKGRMQGSTILNCEPSEKSISKAIGQLYTKQFLRSLKKSQNIYGNGSAAKKITDVLKKFSPHRRLTKPFFDIDF